MSETSPSSRLRIPTSERRLGQVAHELAGQQILTTSLGYAPLAHRLASERFDAQVHCWLFDAYQADRARQSELASPRTRLLLQADAPESPIDLGLVPLSAHGPAELARDLMQSVYQPLVVDGWFAVAVDSRRDRWVRQFLREYDRSIKCHTFGDATVYVLRKRRPLKRLKDYSCTLAFRDQGHLIWLMTRPGVFSHRQLDNGARQLLDAIAIGPRQRVLDLGCGSGAVALALARREPTAEVVALDSHARAVACTQWGSVKNGLANVTAELACADHWRPAQPFDLVAANPPYFSDFRLCEIFLQAARRALRPGGQVVVVTKHPEWYQENMSRWFEHCEVAASRRYFIATGRAGAAIH